MRLRAGDGSAAAELMARYGPELTGRVRKRLGGVLRRKVGASDVTQEAFAAAFVEIGSFEDRGEGSFRAWLYEIVEHKAGAQERHYLGTKKRDVRREITGDLSRTNEDRQPPSPRPSPSAEAMRAEARERLAAAMAGLSEDDALVLRLVHESDLGFREIGPRMNRSPEAARKLYARAVRRLADRLGPSGHGGGSGA